MASLYLPSKRANVHQTLQTTKPPLEWKRSRLPPLASHTWTDQITGIGDGRLMLNNTRNISNNNNNSKRDSNILILVLMLLFFV